MVEGYHRHGVDGVGFDGEQGIENVLYFFYGRLSEN